MRRSLNNFVEQDFSIDNNSDESAVETPDNTDTVENVSNALNNLTVDNNEDMDNEVASAQLRHYSNVQFLPLSYHVTKGINISLNDSQTIAWRHDDEYSNGYVLPQNL